LFWFQGYSKRHVFQFLRERVGLLLRKGLAALTNKSSPRDLVLEVPLRFPCHDQQTAVRQFFCEGNAAMLPFKAKQTFDTQTDGGDDWTHFRLGTGVKPDAVISASIEIAENGVVRDLRQIRVGVSLNRSGHFDARFQ
jgi:hypothetical protein